MISKNVIQLIVQFTRDKDLINVRLTNLSYPDAPPVHNMHGSEVWSRSLSILCARSVTWSLYIATIFLANNIANLSKSQSLQNSVHVCSLENLIRKEPWAVFTPAFIRKASQWSRDITPRTQHKTLNNAPTAQNTETHTIHPPLNYRLKYGGP